MSQRYTRRQTDRPKNLKIQSAIGRSTVLTGHSTSPLLTPKMPKYRPITIVGQGAFGVVYSARAPDNSIVAIKKVLIDPRYKNREYDILKKIDHRNCIKMQTSFKSHGKKNEIYLNIVMDYFPMSLHQFNMSHRKERKFPALIYVRLYGFQIFAGLNYLHSMGITHRDMKPQNVLIDPESGELNICDFGSAKELKPGESSVSYIASRFYRAPELMYNCQSYTNSIDIWAAGCIIAEMLMAGSPLFQGSSSIGQLLEIIKMLGPPTDDDLNSFQHDDVDYSNISQVTSLTKVLPQHTPPDILELLQQIFVYNPSARPTALQCMRHKCFNRLFSKNIMLPNKRPLPLLERNPTNELYSSSYYSEEGEANKHE
ncbi:CMGC family protein kinase [Tritrichomonas foetus]|uniref:non-specific serine/threonine protein kinase n=1 Tax=Tritrichomonas foetus TaxID=1144522 RepID=A0A1J4L444_9EUKA|nr:CMGC family protein kinase [Tritrichomonas foetus]|eukprot:OHT16693.1 CMGC family protein kinase [Tritrichomonas foetus]